MVECRDRVAERAARAARNERQCLVGDLNALAVGDAAQQAHELRQARPRENEGLAPRAHRRKHLGEICGAKDEDEVGRGLLDQLEERVPGGVGELVRLVKDVDLVSPFRGLEHDALPDLANVVDPALRGCVHLDHVQRRAVGDRDAGVADLVRRGRRALNAVEAFGENPSERGLPGAARACEEIGLANLSRRDRVLQRPDDRFLADDLVEVLRTVLPVEGGHQAILAGRVLAAV